MHRILTRIGGCSHLLLSLEVFNQLQVLEVFEPREGSPGHVKVQRLQGLLAQGSPVALGHSQAGHFVGLLEAAASPILYKTKIRP